MECLYQSNCQLRSLALVNAYQTESSMNSVVNFIEQSAFINSLDLSWTQTTANVWHKLIEAVKHHNSLSSLNISNNRLF